MTSTESHGAKSAPEISSVVTFAEGLVGFPSARRFQFESSEEIEPLLRMRCIEGPELAFLLVDPILVDPDYRPALPPDVLAAVGLTDGQPALVLAIARISPRIEECTANLLAPLLLNPESMRGLQVILEPGPWSARHPIVAQPAPSE